MRLHTDKRRRGGFSLVEMVVVLVVIAILCAVSIPAFTGYLSKTAEKRCAVNRQNLHECFLVILDIHKDETPTVARMLAGDYTYLTGDISEFSCPEGGVLSAAADGVSVECSVHSAQGGGGVDLSAYFGSLGVLNEWKSGGFNTGRKLYTDGVSYYASTTPEWKNAGESIESFAARCPDSVVEITADSIVRDSVTYENLNRGLHKGTLYEYTDAGGNTELYLILQDTDDFRQFSWSGYAEKLT